MDGEVSSPMSAMKKLQNSGPVIVVEWNGTTVGDAIDHGNDHLSKGD